MGQYAVIGLGNFGFHITKALFDEGNEVVALDQDKTLVQSTAPFCTQSMVLDATDKENLRNLGLEALDGVIVSVGSNLSSSILITLHLHEMGAKRIIVKAIVPPRWFIPKRRWPSGWPSL